MKKLLALIIILFSLSNTNLFAAQDEFLDCEGGRVQITRNYTDGRQRVFIVSSDQTEVKEVVGEQEHAIDSGLAKNLRSSLNRHLLNKRPAVEPGESEVQGVSEAPAKRAKKSPDELMREMFAAHSEPVRRAPLSGALAPDAQSAQDADMLLAMQASLESLSRPLRKYIELQATATAADSVALIRACDAENKTFTFEALPGHLEHQVILQLPSLCQSYDCLSQVGCYGASDLCGYYAAHVAKIFAANPGATTQQFIDLLNNREAFERETLFPGRDIVLAQRNQTDRDKNTFSSLHGEEIARILPDEILAKTIVIGSSSAAEAFQNEIMVAKAHSLSEAFKSRHIDYLIYILATEHRNHWIPVLVRREPGNSIRIILTDSIGEDRRSSAGIRELFRNFTGSMAPQGQSGQFMPLLNHRGIAFGGPIDPQQRQIDAEHVRVLQNQSSMIWKNPKGSAEKPTPCLVM